MKNLKKNAGFTLVELIVVIAILGILAGVGTVAYTGYVEKANKAADEQTLAALNTAFVSACYANIGETYEPTPTININSANGTLANEVTDNESVNKTFKEMFGDAAFKVVTEIFYDNNMGLFKVDALLSATKPLLASSSFSKTTMSGLTGDVDKLVGSMSSYLSNSGNRAQIIGSGFNDYLQNSLGYTAEQIEAMSSTEISNAAVLYLAKNAADMDSGKFTNVTNKLGQCLENVADGEDLSLSDMNELGEAAGSSLAGYAMLYATAEAIALSQDGGAESEVYKALQSADKSDTAAVLNAVGTVFSSVGRDAIDDYLDDNYLTDMEAYFKTLQLLNGKESELKGNLNTSDLYTNNEAVKDLIAQLGGN